MYVKSIRGWKSITAFIFKVSILFTLITFDVLSTLHCLFLCQNALLANALPFLLTSDSSSNFETCFIESAVIAINTRMFNCHNHRWNLSSKPVNNNDTIHSSAVLKPYHLIYVQFQRSEPCNHDSLNVLKLNYAIN